jgi:flagellar biosynthesis/type III secretory pathway M-ring protein FliF/YscJ
MSDALPDNGGYVAAAYLVFLALLLIYLAIAALRASRLERRLQELNDLAAEREAPAAPDREPAGAVTGSAP